MKGRLFRCVVAMLVLPVVVSAQGPGAASPPQAPPPQAPLAGPTFKSGVDLIRLDVTVVAKDGSPVADLAPEDFEVRVGGRVRPVVTSRFLSLQPVTREAPRGSSLASTRDFSGNDGGTTGRLFVLAVDHESLPSGAGRPLMMAAAKLLERLGPTDRVALVAVPQPGQRVEFTNDLQDVTRGLGRITGRRQSRVRTVRVNFEEAQGFEGRNQIVMDNVYDRECRSRSIDATCGEQLQSEAIEVLVETRERAMTTLSHLSGLFDSLAGIDGPKTVILFSAGIGFETRSLSRFKEVAQRAIEARLSMYIVHVDSFAFDTSERASSAAFMGDSDSGMIGLGTLAGLTGGVLLRGVAEGQGVWERIDRESGGLYVLGVEPEAGTLPTEPLDLRVRVKRPGLVVRTPQQVVPAASLTVWPDAKRALGYTLRQPRPATELPMKVATYTVRGNANLRLKTVIAAELALPVGQAMDLAWGFEVLDKGRVIADAFDHGLPHGSSATHDGVVLTTAVSLPAGTYTLRFAAVDHAGRRGSVEHPITVGLRMTHTGLGTSQSPERLYFSDLLVGHDVAERFQPRLQFAADTGDISALLELYGGPASRLDHVAVEFDVRGLDGVTRLAMRVTPAKADGDFRHVAFAQLPTSRLGAGSYQLYANVLLDGRAIGTVRRQVTITPGATASAQ